MSSGGGLPRQLLFPQLKQNAVRAISQQFACTPIQGTSWSPGGTIAWDIPCSQLNTFLSPEGVFLMYDVTVTTGGGGNVALTQFGAPDFISSLALYSSASAAQLEAIPSCYAALNYAMRDLCSTASQSAYADSLLQGFDPLRTRTPLTNSIAGTGGSFTTRFCMPLISSLSTLCAGKIYWPTAVLNAPLRLELGLSSAANALTVLATAPQQTCTYTITNAVLVISQISIAQAAMDELRAMNGNVWQWTCDSYKVHRAVHPAGQASNTIQIPARNDSLVGLVVVPRLAANLENQLRQSNLERIRGYVQTYTLRCGSSFITGKPVWCAGNAAEAFQECRRLFGSVCDETNSTLMCLKDYPVDDAIAPKATCDRTAADHGCWLICVDLQSFNNTNLCSGQSTLASNCWLDLVFDPTKVASIPSIAFDVFAVADQQYTVDGTIGTVTVRS